MTFKTFCAILAIVCGVTGLIEILVPAKFLTVLGDENAPTSVLILSIRELGILYFAFSLIFWFSRNITNKAARKAILTGVGVGTIGLSILSVYGFTLGIYTTPVGYAFAIVFFISGLLALYLLAKRDTRG